MEKFAKNYCTGFNKIRRTLQLLILGYRRMDVVSPQGFSFLLRKNLLERHQLVLCREITAVCSEIHTEHTNALCGQDVENNDRTSRVS
jgi:hypothetical protein